MTAESEPQARILVVDDVPANVRLLEAVLEPPGFAVSSASSGPETVERAVTELPDLVLLDVQMAGMNGYEVCRRIRENEATALVPIVMVTSHESEARIDGIRAGADDFVTKPFDQQELLLRVRSLVRVKRYHDTIRAQAAELAEWNRTLEGRVAEQVEELERMARLRRFLSPTLAEVVMSRGDSVLGKPPARARRPLRRPARLDRFQRGHGAGGSDERRRLLPLGDGRADPQVRGDGRVVRRRRTDGLVQRPDPVRRAGGAGGAAGARDAGRDGRPYGEVAEARARARLLARCGARLRDDRPDRLRGSRRLRRRRQRPQPRLAPLRRRAAGPDRR